MEQRRPLNDAWLYWDAERLEGFPHSDGGAFDCEHTARGDAGGGPRRPLRLRLTQDILLYAAGVASALFGVGLAVLLGSFISAYSVLTEVSRSGIEPIIDYPSMSSDKIALLTNAATAAQIRTPPGSASEVTRAPSGTVEAGTQ